MWIENGHKMPKKGPIKLKFGPNVYFYVFYRFPNDFLKILKIGRFLAKKRQFFPIFAYYFWYYFSPEKNRSRRRMVGMS